MSGYESPFVRGSDAELCGFVWVVSGTEIDLPSDVRKTTYRTANPMHTHTHARAHTHTHTHTHTTECLQKGLAYTYHTEYHNFG